MKLIERKDQEMVAQTLGICRTRLEHLTKDNCPVADAIEVEPGKKDA